MNDLLYGRQPVAELLRAGRRRVFNVYVQRGSRPCPVLDDIRREADRRGCAAQSLDGGEFARRAGRVNHQGVLAECATFPYTDFGQLLERGTHGAVAAPLLLIADHIEDPQNLGSMLRTAEACGVSGVVIPRDRAVHITPTVVRASAGASEHLRAALVTNLARALRELRAADVRLVGLEAVAGAVPHTEAELGTGALGLVVGSEGHGLKRLTRECCDVLIRLPMKGRVTSLNAGAATAVALYEIVRQREAASARTHDARA